MATQACPDCAGLVSTQAAYCPHCGRPGYETGITVSNVDVSFGRLVALMVKTAFAAIPALIVIGVIVAAAVIVLGGVFGR